MEADEKRLVSLSELAQMVGLSPSQLRLGYRRGGLPHIRVGNRLLFDPSEVVEWLKAGHGRDLNRHRREELAEMLARRSEKGGGEDAKAASSVR